MTDLVTNFAKVTVSTTYTSGDTAIVLTGGHGAKFPAAASATNTTHFNVVWYNSTDYPDPSDDPNVEIVRVTNRSTDTLTVVRAQEGTTATNKNTAGKTYKMILAPTRKTILDLQIKEPAQYVATVSHPSASRDTGVAFTIGSFMKAGVIKELTVRGSYTMGTLYAWSAYSSSATNGFLPAGTTFQFTGKTGSIFVGDYISIDNEILYVAQASAAYLVTARGKKNTYPSYHAHNTVMTKLVNGVRIELFTDSRKKPQNKFYELNNILTYSGLTNGSINASGTVIRLSAAPVNLSTEDRILIQDTTSETAIVQSIFGAVTGTSHDNTIFIKGSPMGLHVSNKNIQKVVVSDIPIHYKGSSNTLYGNLYIDERVVVGGTITLSLGITCDKFGSMVLS